MTKEEAEKQYKEYLEGHIGNVGKTLELLTTLDIPFVNDNIDTLREIVKEHDKSKYEEPEWSAYLHHFYPTNDEESMMEEEFDSAVKHHITNNKHHWNYWCDENNNLINDIDEEEYKLYTIERICDWTAMAAQHEEGPTEYWNINKEFIIQPDYATEMCEEILNKLPEDFSKDMWKITRGDLDECMPVSTLNRDVVKDLGKRVKKSKTSNTVEIDTQMTNHDKQLGEEVDNANFDVPRDDIYVHTDTDNHLEGYVPVLGYGYYLYQVDHISKTIHKDKEEGKNTYYKLVSNKIIKVKNIDTIPDFPDNLVKDLANASKFSEDVIRTTPIEELLSMLAYRVGKGISDIMIRNNIDGILMEDASDMYGGEDVKELLIYNMEALEKIEPLDESILTEMTANQIIQKSKNQDPDRIYRSKKVKTTYIGMSKFGILNFKTTSQTRTGYHYQTVEFKDMGYFEDIIKSGNKITPDNIKEAINKQDINIWCTDESFTYWAWGHLAYIDDFLYIDDRIPDLKKRIQAPKINNVDLNGGSCKHILSVLEYMKKPFVLLAISDDMNAYLQGTSTESPKAEKQTDETKNRLDQVKSWDWEDVEKYTGLSKIQIISDISKTIQTTPGIDKEDVIADIVGEALPAEQQGLRRAVTDKVIELADEEK